MGSDGNIYKSLAGTEETPNVNNNPTLSGSVSWKSIFTDFAKINGDETKRFKVADAVEINEAINKKQFDDNAVKLNGNQTIDDVKTFTSSPIVPTPTTNTQVANKSYVDGKIIVLQPTLTGTATFTATDNKIVMTGIVTSLGLEVGDVIQFTSGTDATNAKMRTVESITNDNTIIVNYYHSGSMGNGSLKLSDQSGISCTVKRVAKYYNAPIDLGRDYVRTLTLRTVGATFTNNTNRALSVSLVGANTTDEDAFDLTQDGKVISRGTKQGSASEVRPSSANGALVANKDWSIVRTSGSGALTSLEELR